MKKLLVLLLVLATVFCLASCEYLPEDFQSTIDSLKGKCENLYEDAQSTVDSAIDKVKDVLGIESSCEHNWISATCTAPRTCSVCGVTEGEANGHTEVTVAGTSATCTDAGMTDGKKCSVCGEIIVQQTAISALGHTEETIAGTPATCTEAGISDGKKCTVCGVTTVEQTVIDALGHKPEADDGDVTTPVECANEGCNHIFVEAKDAITFTIPTFENGTVTADKKNYAIGDTVKLTINPEFDYAQKLYINDEPLILDWNTNVYNFVVEEDTYVISGSFEPTMNMAAGDETRWDYINQAHGIITTYYPNNNDAWWFQINGEYKSFSITAKNYREIANSYENGPDGGWAVVLYMKLDNGNYYAFRMWIDTNKIYAYQHFGGKVAGDKDSTTGWSGAWRNLAEWNAEATAALNGDGAEFKLDRIDGNHIQVTFGGVVLETYEIPGVTAENKVVAVGLHHWGNKGAHVDIPFAVTVPTPVQPEPPVEDDAILTIGEFANGTVTADKDSYNVGDTVTLTVAPAKDYAQKLYINGEALLVDTNSKYSFVVEEGKTYDITGEFVSVKGDWYWTNNGEFGLLNQAHGIINVPAHAGKDATGELVPTLDKCYGGKVLVKDPFNGTKQDYAIVLKMAFSDGQKAEIRLVNKDGKGHYMVQSMSGMFGSWKWYYDLNDEENAAIANGEGVWFELVRDGANIDIIVNGKVLAKRADTPISLSASTVLNQFKVQAYNFDKAVDIKYEFYMYE